MRRAHGGANLQHACGIGKATEHLALARNTEPRIPRDLISENILI